jgi:hypothetical protein
VIGFVRHTGGRRSEGNQSGQGDGSDQRKHPHESLLRAEGDDVQLLPVSLANAWGNVKEKGNEKAGSNTPGLTEMETHA